MALRDVARGPTSIIDHMSFSLNKSGNTKGQRRHAGREILERVGVSDFAMRYPSTPSGGQRPRTSLAVTLVAPPDMILVDEPLSNLDARPPERLRIEIADLTRGADSSVLDITPYQTDAFSLADLIDTVNEGHSVQVAGPKERYRNPATPFVDRCTGVAGELDALIADRADDRRLFVRAAPQLITAPGVDRLEPDRGEHRDERALLR